MVALVIAGFLSIGLWALMESQNTTYATQDNAAQMQQNLRAAVDRISRDFLSAGQGPQVSWTGNGWYASATNWQPYNINNGANQIDMIGCTVNQCLTNECLSTGQGFVGYVAAGGAAAGSTTINLDPANGASAAIFQNLINAYGTVYFNIGGLEGGKITAVGANSITISRPLTQQLSGGDAGFPCPVDHLPGQRRKPHEGPARRQRAAGDSLLRHRTEREHADGSQFPPRGGEPAALLWGDGSNQPHGHGTGGQPHHLHGDEHRKHEEQHVGGATAKERRIPGGPPRGR